MSDADFVLVNRNEALAPAGLTEQQASEGFILIASLTGAGERLQQASGSAGGQVLLQQRGGGSDACTGQGCRHGPSSTAEPAATTPPLALPAVAGHSSEVPCMLSQHITTPAAQQEGDHQVGACHTDSSPVQQGRSRQQRRLAVCLLLLAALCLASSTLLHRRLAALLQQDWRLMAAQAAGTWQATTTPAPAAGEAQQTGCEAASAAASVALQKLPKTEQDHSTARPLDARAEGRKEQMCTAASSSTVLQVASRAEPVRPRRRAKQAPSAALLAAGTTQIATQQGAALQASTQPAAACMGGDKAQRLDNAFPLQPASKEGNDGDHVRLSAPALAVERFQQAQSARTQHILDLLHELRQLSKALPGSDAGSKRSRRRARRIRKQLTRLRGRLSKALQQAQRAHASLGRALLKLCKLRAQALSPGQGSPRVAAKLAAKMAGCLVQLQHASQRAQDALRRAQSLWKTGRDQLGPVIERSPKAMAHTRHISGTLAELQAASVTSAFEPGISHIGSSVEQSDLAAWVQLVVTEVQQAQAQQAGQTDLSFTLLNNLINQARLLHQHCKPGGAQLALVPGRSLV